MSNAQDAQALSNAMAQSQDVETLAVELLAAVPGPAHYDVGPGGETVVIRSGWGPLKVWSDYLWISYPGT